MDLFDTLIGPAWVQVGELGLAFVVVLLCSSLVLFVMKTSARREQELLQIITKVLPVMESMSSSMVLINTRLEHIEDSVGIKPEVKVPKKSGAKKKVADG